MDKALRATLALLLLAKLLPAQHILPQMIQPDPSTFGYQTYSDNFTRANGSLGSNWTSVNVSTCGLQILSDMVWASGTPCSNQHALAYYSAGSFNNNQWASYIVGTGNGSNDEYNTQTACVRCSATNGYNDAFPSVVSSAYQIGTLSPLSDFTNNAGVLNAYSTGDLHKLAVAGSGPVFFWSFRQPSGSSSPPTVDATGVDTSGVIPSGGAPGVGVIEFNSPQSVSVGAWQGGSLPNFSSTSSWDFTAQPDDGWLGVNWWLTGEYNSPTAAFLWQKSGAASLNVSGSVSNGEDAAVWMTPFGSNQAATVTIGTITSGDYAGPIVRFTPSESGGSSHSFYMAVWDSGTLYLFKEPGVTLTTVAVASQPSTIELDASGTSPVTLTVKTNGTTQITYTDSTYLLTGVFEGFTVYGHNTTTVTGWAGH